MILWLTQSKDIRPSTIEKYLPQKREVLAYLWIELLQLSTHLARILALHYRPRRPLLCLAELESDDYTLRSIRDGLTPPTDQEPDTSLLHTFHLQSYVDLVVIVLHRPYMLNAPGYLTMPERQSLRSTARRRAKDAAADITAIASKLIALDLVDLSPHMLVATTMSAAQIHLFEIKTSNGLCRQFALNHYNLHVLILAQLHKTYWTATYQHQLFTETLKAMEECEKVQMQQEAANVSAKDESRQQTNNALAPNQVPRSATPGETVLDWEGFEGTGTSTQDLEELFLSFNPNSLLNLPMDFDAP